LYQWEGVRGREMVKESEYGANTVYSMYINGKMILVEILQEWGGGGDERRIRRE
jgi:hypothetical protein